MDKEPFQAWLYTLDILERSPYAEQRLADGSLLYIDDRVQVYDKFDPRYNSVGTIRAITLHEGTVLFQVQDDEYVAKLREFSAGFYNPLDEEIGRRVDEGFEGFKEDVERDNPLILQLHTDAEWRDIYRHIVQKEVYENISSRPEYRSYEDSLREVEERYNFWIPEEPLSLVEQFPPNRLFRK